MRRLTSLTLALAITTLAMLALHAVVAAQSDGRPSAAARATPTPTPEPCAITATHKAAPGVLALGEEVTITLHLAARCRPAPPIPLHIVLVIDPSAAMGGSLMRDVREAATKLVDSLNLAENPHIKVAVVEVRTHASRVPQGGSTEDARTLVHLTNTALRVKNAVKRIRAEGVTQTELGIEEGLRV